MKTNISNRKRTPVLCCWSVGLDILTSHILASMSAAPPTAHVSSLLQFPGLTCCLVALLFLVVLLALTVFVGLVLGFNLLTQSQMALRLVQAGVLTGWQTAGRSVEGRHTDKPGSGDKILSSAPRLTQPADSRQPRQFRLELSRQLLPAVHQYVTGYLQQHGQEQEAGGMLVGEFLTDDDGQAATFRICGFIDAGPDATSSAGHIRFDAEYQAQALSALQMEHPRSVNLGCIHRHPDGLDFCSGGDKVTDTKAVGMSDTKALIFGIITLNNPCQCESSPLHENMKFDFYLMAEETAYDYVPINPVLVDRPLLGTSRAVQGLRAIRGPSVIQDWGVLSRLRGLERATLSATGPAAEAGVLLTVSYKNAVERLHVWVKPEGGLQVFIKNGSQQAQGLAGPWEQAEVGRHIWLSHLVLLASNRWSETRLGSDAPCHFAGLLEDKYRLVAEVRAMQEHYGRRAVLRRRGSTLYWEYVVHESGRSFPIEIRYPDSYPADPPTIVSVKALPASPHQLGDNVLCWIDFYSRHSEWNPARDTAVICVNAAHRWFACLLVYLSTGRWPEGAED